MEMEFETRKKSKENAIIMCWVSALVFFAGLLLYIANVSEGVNSIALTITGIGGVLLLVSYLFMKYASYKVNTFDNGSFGP